MKLSNTIVRQIAVDGLSFMMVLALLVGGLWGLSLVDASVYLMTIFGAIMVPALISTGTSLGKDINKAAHKLIA